MTGNKTTEASSSGAGVSSENGFSKIWLWIIIIAIILLVIGVIYKFIKKENRHSRW
jgi:LPS O-antigen subunit length determinant protein (WzzB/FepE family)